MDADQWAKHHGLNDRFGSEKPNWDPTLVSGTCDWGGCDRFTSEWRRKPDGEWLPVCKFCYQSPTTQPPSSESGMDQ